MDRRNSDNQKTFLSTFIIDITSSFYTSDTIRFLILTIFCLSPILQELSNLDDLNVVWYTIFVIGYRLRSYGFVRGGETNEPYHRARSYYYSGRHSRDCLVFRLQMAR